MHYIHYSVPLFNEFILLQVAFLFVLFYFILFWDNFFLILNSLIYLFITSLFAWLLEADIFINFLIIIDLGVFFVLLAFLVNYVSLFNNTTLKVFKLKRWVFAAVFILLTLNADFSTYTTTAPFHVTYYNWYAIFNFHYFTDLQLLSDLYYVFASFEFIIMNFYIYVIILLLYSIQTLLTALGADFIINYSSNSLVSVRGNYMRTQNLQFQVNQKPLVRVWSKK